jgi:hypothetical protein
MSGRRLIRGARRRLRPALAVALLAALSGVVSACGDTLQTQPVDNAALEKWVTSREVPIYWVGGSFEGMQLSNLNHDPGGAFGIQYGNCTIGGQGVCVTPLQILTSPDNSFLPGGSVGRRITTVRGRPAVLAEAGRTIEIPTGPVVVTISADTPARARRAADQMLPLNAPGAPGDTLPAALPDTGFDHRPPHGATGPGGDVANGSGRASGPSGTAAAPQ